MISSEIASTTGGGLSADITRLPPSKLVPFSPLASSCPTWALLIDPER